MTHEAFHEVNKKVLSSIFQSLFPVKKKKQKYSRKKRKLRLHAFHCFDLLENLIHIII